MSWLETYRGTVHRWEVDNVDHFTVGYYFARFEDATAALLHALGLEPGSLASAGGACVVTDCRVRYLKELRVGDILHIRSGVVAIDGQTLLLGHEVLESASGTVCTTVEQRAIVVKAGSRTAQPLTAAQRAAAGALRVDWSSAPEPGRPGPPASALAPGDEGFLDTARDAVKPWEVDGQGHAGWPAYVHRFSAANAHAIAAFGITPAYMRERRRGFSTFEFRLRFPGALRAGDLVRVQSGLLHVGSSSLRLLHRMVNGATGELAATLEQSGVHLDLDARRPIPLPEELRERARALLVVPAAGP